jgi:hypothetical protein
VTGKAKWGTSINKPEILGSLKQNTVGSIKRSQNTRNDGLTGNYTSVIQAKASGEKR